MSEVSFEPMDVSRGPQPALDQQHRTTDYFARVKELLIHQLFPGRPNAPQQPQQHAWAPATAAKSEAAPEGAAAAIDPRKSGGGVSGAPLLLAPPRHDQDLHKAEAAGVPYDADLIRSIYEDEPNSTVDPHYLATQQPDIDAHRRLVLVDWMVEVVDEFKLGQSTLFLAVRYVDRFLSRAAVARRDLQLLGVTALWLACKFEEVYPPTLSDFVDITQGSPRGAPPCAASSIVAMERALLRELAFRLASPTAHTFLVAFAPAAAANAADADAYLSAAVEAGESSDGGCDSEDPGSPACGSASDASGSSSSVGSGGGVRFPGARLPAANARAGPRAAPHYPYPVGSPCPAGPRAPAAPPAGPVGAAVAPRMGPGALGDAPRRVAYMAEYLAELSLLTPECLRFPPSVIAAAALQLACALLEVPPGLRARLAPAAEAAAARAGRSGGALLQDAAEELQRMFVYAARAPRPPATKFKYGVPARGCVSAVPVPGWLPG